MSPASLTCWALPNELTESYRTVDVPTRRDSERLEKLQLKVLFMIRRRYHPLGMEVKPGHDGGEAATHTRMIDKVMNPDSTTVPRLLLFQLRPFAFRDNSNR